MRQVALAGGHAITYADTTSVLAACALSAAPPPRPFRHRDAAGRSSQPISSPPCAASRELAREAVKYLAIMALVDGVTRSLASSRASSNIRAPSTSKPTISPISSRRPRAVFAWATADMWRKNFDSILSRSSEGLDPNVWVRPYGGDSADPDLVARYEGLGKLAAEQLRQGSVGLRQTERLSRSRAIRRRSTPALARRTI